MSLPTVSQAEMVFYQHNSYLHWGYEFEGRYYIRGYWPANNHLVEHREDTPMQPLDQWCKKKYPDMVDLRKADYCLGEYFPRISRGPWTPNNEIADGTERTRSFAAAQVLVRNLETVFECVEPDNANAAAFGHEIRNALLLACMELESSFSAVLKANHCRSNGRWNITDFQKLDSPLRLKQYQVRLAQYPKWQSFRPFENWDASQAGQSLSWWSAYNKTKHDRESSFHLGTLLDAITAVGAVAIMLAVQFGGLSANARATDLINRHFIVERIQPVTQEDFYLPRPDGKWSPIDLEL
jgi:hypothetical protein